MRTKLLSYVASIAALCCSLPLSADGFQKQDSAQYVNQFQALTANAYAVADDLSAAPLGLNACREEGVKTATGTVVITEPLSTIIGASEVQSLCGQTNHCVIGENVTVEIDQSLKLHSLVVKDGGTVRWTDQTQTSPDAWMCAGYAVVEEGGSWDMNLQDTSKRAWIYIMNNGATHHGLRTRAFGSYMPMHHSSAESTMNSDSAPYLSVIGRELSRTWSLLAEPLEPNTASIKLMHDPIEMGWKVGDRIAVAPTERGMSDDGQDFFISDMSPNGIVTLSASSNGTSTHRAERIWAGFGEASLRAAEVINLSRNIIISGDDFEEIACDANLKEAWPGFGTSTQGCMCTNNRNSCTMGLHTASAHGGFSEIANVRVEKCGQRGVEGKYCLHFHHMSNCSDSETADGSKCIARNNAVEFSQQRGLILHSTHNAKVESNVFYDVRGANLYIEDGNEMLNSLSYNVAICPRGDNGCTLPGTSNGQADTSLNQSGLYMESPNNLLVGNRMANHFNGMFNNAGNGRGAVDRQVCGDNVAFGLWEGNTFHSSGRFGTYLLNGNYPLKNTGQSLSNNGTTNGDNCASYDSMGEDMGLSSVILSHFDYGNTFVGQYSAGDIQYKHHVNINNLNSIYWKETKTFEDGCSAHISDSYYEDGAADLPDAMGAFIIENTTFKKYGLRANHHCDVGVTGYLCMPHYVLHDVEWLEPRNTWMNFDINNGNTNYGGIFSLSPANIAAKEAGQVFNLFPTEYNSAVGQSFEYLLSLPDENCTRSGDIGLANRYNNGILCAAPLTALKVFTQNHSGGDLILTVFDRETKEQLAQQRVPHLNITDKKQGYSVPVISGDKYQYEMALASGADIGPYWVIDFGDLTVSNRWGVEQLHIDIQGRSCGGTIYSNHDRRFYASGDFSNDMWGRGACTTFPDMPASNCSVTPDLSANQDPSYAQSHVQLDSVCESVDCGENGICSARYLGSVVPVLPAYQCVCKDGWSGSACQTSGDQAEVNQLPELVLVSSISIDENTSKTFNFAVSDPENDALAIDISVLTGEGLTVELLDSNDGFTITAPNITADQSYTIEVSVSDGFNVIRQETAVTVLFVNQLPIVTMPSTSLVGDEGDTIEIIAAANDEDNQELYFQWEQTSGISVSFTQNLATLTANLPQVSGDQSVSFKVTVSDGIDTVSQNMTLVIKDTTPAESPPAPAPATPPSPAPVTPPTPAAAESGGGSINFFLLMLLIGVAGMRRFY